MAPIRDAITEIYFASADDHSSTFVLFRPLIKVCYYGGYRSFARGIHGIPFVKGDEKIMKKRILFVSLLLIGMLIVSACGASPQPSGGGVPAPNGANDSGGNASQSTAAPSTGNAGNTTGDQIDLSDVSQGLDTLNAYKSTFNMSFDGTEDGQAKKWTVTTAEEFSKDPPAKHTVFNTTGTGSEDSKFEVIEVGGKSYTIFGDTCASSETNAAPTASQAFTPSSVIGDIQGSQLVGSETVNGVPAQHFKVDLSRFSTLGLYSDATSDVWVAAPGGYVVKYTFEATGKDAFFGAGTNTEGTIHWEYEVSNVNQPIDVAPPENCGGAQADIPVMADAKNASSFGDTSTYSSASAFDDVVNFYKTQMPANGWTEDESSGFSGGGFASLSFKKDTQTASITITFDKDKNETSVLISVSK